MEMVHLKNTSVWRIGLGKECDLNREKQKGIA